MKIYTALGLKIKNKIFQWFEKLFHASQLRPEQKRIRVKVRYSKKKPKQRLL